MNIGISDLFLSRSNSLIDCMQNFTLLENKLITFGLATCKIDKNDMPYADINIGILKKFDAKILTLIDNISTPYTTSHIQTLMSFKSNYAYRLYEILAKQEHLLYPKNKEKQQNIPKSVIVK